MNRESGESRSKFEQLEEKIYFQCKVMIAVSAAASLLAFVVSNLIVPNIHLILPIAISAISLCIWYIAMRSSIELPSTVIAVATGLVFSVVGIIGVAYYVARLRDAGDYWLLLNWSLTLGFQLFLTLLPIIGWIELHIFMNDYHLEQIDKHRIETSSAILEIIDALDDRQREQVESARKAIQLRKETLELKFRPDISG